MPPAAWVQGDDYAGGNPPFPNYVNTAAFDAWYTSSGTYRRFYDISYASAGVDHIIDSSVQFNGHNTLRMDFGAGHFGAGWDSLLSDDGDPVETNGPFFGGYQGIWLNKIFKAETGVMSDVGATGFGQGLVIFGIETNNFADQNIINRNGNIYLDVDYGGGHGGHQAPALICNENVFFGRSSGFGQLIVLYERINTLDDSFQLRVWAGDACSLGGVSPLYNQQHFPTSSAITNGVYGIRNYNAVYTLSGAIKHLWNAGTRYDPSFVSEGGSLNPYGVALT